MVARHRRLYHARREHRLQLLRHERVFPVLRARIRLEPNGDLRGVFPGARRVGIVGAHRPIIAGFLYDLTHSYTIAFGIFAAVSLGAVALLFLAKRPQATTLS
jgi:hypothetical protein